MGGNGEAANEIITDSNKNGEPVLYTTHWKARKCGSRCGGGEDTH